MLLSFGVDDAVSPFVNALSLCAFSIRSEMELKDDGASRRRSGFIALVVADRRYVMSYVIAEHDLETKCKYLKVLLCTSFSLSIDRSISFNLTQLSSTLVDRTTVFDSPHCITRKLSIRSYHCISAQNKSQRSFIPNHLT